MIYTLSLFFSLLLTTVLVPPLKKLAVRIGMVDVPDARKVHSGNIPRSGGIALAIGALVPLLFIAPSKPFMTGICLGSALILIEGVVDDVCGLGYRFKFAGQFLAALVTVWATGLHFVTFGRLIPGYHSLDCGVLGYPLSVFFLIATTNIINLSDGLDGLAGGICFLIFAATAFLALIGRDFATVAFSMCMGGAIVGFLRYNTHPAVVFLGDAGSQFLGFMTGVTMLLFTTGGVHHSPIVVMFILGIPVLDTVMVMVRRAIEKRSLFQPDAGHLHHRLLLLGLKHHQAVSVIYAAQLLMIMIGWSLCGISTAALFGLYLFLLFLAVIAAAFPLPRFSHYHLGSSDDNNLCRQKDNEFVSASWLSRNSVSRIAWLSLVSALMVFFILTPIWMRPVPSFIGFYSAGFMLILAAVMMLRPNLFVVVTKIAGYFFAIYYIMALDFSANFPGLLWCHQNRWFLFAILLLMAASYLIFLAASMEELPIITIDYLLLGLVVLTFFLPDSIQTKFHVNTIAAKVLLVFLSLELVTFKLKGRIEVLAPAAFLSLGISLLMALWPWMV